tara:strand:+ start:403 stop:1392 length:990 start_codon:yes stop_codon:yes gene_type:complete
MRIAIVKLSSLGDIVNTMFVLQFIKKHYPLSEIDWIVEKNFEGVLKYNPHISNIKTINLQKAKREKSLLVLLRELSKVKSFGDYDLVIDFQGLIKTAIVSKLLRSKKIVGFDWSSIREGVASFIYDQKVNIGYDKNTILRYKKLVSEALNFKITEEDLLKKEPFLFNQSAILLPKKTYIVLVIGSTWDSRNYPKEKFVKVANLLQKDCIVVWGNEHERQKAEWMISKSSYISVMPKLSLDDLKLVIGSSSLLIGNDTGPSHFSWALNIPSILLFGPSPVERMFQTDLNKAIKSKSKINHKKLNKNDFSIKEISTNEIVKISQQLLGSNT